MVELFEYSLVILASSAIVGFSFFVAASYSGSAEPLQDRLAFSRVSDAAWRAIEHGNATASAELTDASVSCHGGNLTLVSRGFLGDVVLPVGCDFSFSGLNGVHLFRFSRDAGWLQGSVS